MRFHVTNKSWLPSKHFITVLTDIGFITCVFQSMATKAGFLSKHLTTFIAYVWFLTRVYSQMFTKGTFLRKLSTALLAWKWLFSSVFSQMFIKGTFLRKLFIALLAWKLLLSRVCSHVNLKQGITEEWFHTHAAFVILALLRKRVVDCLLQQLMPLFSFVWQLWESKRCFVSWLVVNTGGWTFVGLGATYLFSLEIRSKKVT